MFTHIWPRGKKEKKEERFYPRRIENKMGLLLQLRVKFQKKKKKKEIATPERGKLSKVGKKKKKKSSRTQFCPRTNVIPLRLKSILRNRERWTSCGSPLSVLPEEENRSRRRGEEEELSRRGELCVMHLWHSGSLSCYLAAAFSISLATVAVLPLSFSVFFRLRPTDC